MCLFQMPHVSRILELVNPEHRVLIPDPIEFHLLVDLKLVLAEDCVLQHQVHEIRGIQPGVLGLHVQQIELNMRHFQIYYSWDIKGYLFIKLLFYLLVILTLCWVIINWERVCNEI